VVGARAAARQRALTGSDRSPADGLITPGLLREWGVADTVLDEAMGQGYRYAASTMLLAGRQDEAIALLRTGRRRSNGRGGLAAVMAGVCSGRAKAAFREGRFLAGVSWGLKAWRAQPSLPLQLLRRRVGGVRSETGRAGSRS
jgi:hypothetical protein